MKKFLTKPYPSIIEDGYKKSTIINLAVALVVFFILYVFKPTLFFEDTVRYTLLDSLMFAGITLFVSIFFTNILPRIFTTFFNPQKWTVGKEIFFLIGILFFISLANFAIGRRVFYPNAPFEWLTFFEVVLATYIIGIIPIIVVFTFYLYFNQNKLKLKAQAINSSIVTKSIATNSQPLSLRGEGKYESLECNEDDLLFIESTGNYCDIYYIQNGVKKITFRISLAKIHQQLPSQRIIKTHRSFLINLSHISNVEGNAQGYQIALNHFDDRTIPVSRSNISTFDAAYQ